MGNFLLGVSIFLSVLAILSLYRAIFGPTDIDRIIGVGAVGTKTLIILILMGFIYKRVDMFVDIALLYAIINFIGGLIFARYFVRKGVL
jgi:multicomponent Na+:H+ antiporter subunit F